MFADPSVEERERLAIEKRRKRDEERRQRLLDPKKRQYGVCIFPLLNSDTFLHSYDNMFHCLCSNWNCSCFCVQIDTAALDEQIREKEEREHMEKEREAMEGMNTWSSFLFISVLSTHGVWEGYIPLFRLFKNSQSH
jgi:hypothetical protein